MTAPRLTRSICVLLLLTGCALRGPKPPETIPDAYRPDGTPVERTPPPPPPRQLNRPPPDPPYHFALITDVQRVSISETGGPFDQPQLNPTMWSFDLTLQRGAGIGPGAAARFIRGSGQVPVYAEGALLFGSRRFSADLALATRYGPHLLFGGSYDSLHTFFRVGGRTKVDLGRSGFALQLRASRYYPVPAPGTSEHDLRGWSSDAWLHWAHARTPLTLNIGYRHERFLLRSWRQETSSLVLGSGIVLGRR